MLLLIAFVTLLVVLTSWLSRKSGTPSPGETAAANQLPDYYLHGLEATITGEDGSPRHRLKAETLRHYPDTDTTELEQPDVTVLGKGNATWHVRATRGTVETAAQQILLSGEVRLRQRGDNGMEMQTEWLRLDTARQYAETDASVLLKSRSARVQGIGMQAYGEQQRLLLQSTVRGRYVTD